MTATTLSFRAGREFAEETRALADTIGLKSSEYIRQAVCEMNARILAERIASLSRELAADHLEVNESIEGTLADGLE